jgi:phage terminase large subunit-like protein
MDYTYQQYIDDVTQNKITVGKWVKLAVKRHLDDLAKPDFPYYFDPTEGEKFIRFAQLLKHVEGNWSKTNLIELLPWQQFISVVLFGWRRKKDGKRRFSHALIEMARKNGKSLFASIVGLYVTFVENEPGNQGVVFATKYDQACIVWNVAKKIVEQSKGLNKRIRIRHNSLVSNNGSTLKPLGQDSKTSDGLNVGLGICDEYHEHPSSSLYDVIDTATGTRPQSLLLTITTAGFDLMSPAKAYEDRVKKVLEGIDVEDTLFGIIYTIDDGDDWTDEKVWYKANPNLGTAIDLEKFSSQLRRAEKYPIEQNNVKTKCLSIWTQSTLSWITNAKWNLCCDKFNVDELLGRVCYGALDLSSTLDLTAYALCFPPVSKGEKFKLLVKFYLPEDDIVEHGRKDKVDYVRWNREGLITLTPGSTIQYSAVESDIMEDAKKYKIREIAYDQWHAQEMTSHLNDKGLTVLNIVQQFNGMAVPTREFERAMYDATIATNNNEILNWQIMCCELQWDRKGNFLCVKPARDGSGKRIDGIIACIMAYYRAYVNGLQGDPVGLDWI